MLFLTCFSLACGCTYNVQLASVCVFLCFGRCSLSLPASPSSVRSREKESSLLQQHFPGHRQICPPNRAAIKGMPMRPAVGYCTTTYHEFAAAQTKERASPSHDFRMWLLLPFPSSVAASGKEGSRSGRMDDPGKATGAYYGTYSL